MYLKKKKKKKKKISKYSSNTKRKVRFNRYMYILIIWSKPDVESFIFRGTVE